MTCFSYNTHKQYYFNLTFNSLYVTTLKPITECHLIIDFSSTLLVEVKFLSALFWWK